MPTISQLIRKGREEVEKNETQLFKEDLTLQEKKEQRYLLHKKEDGNVSKDCYS